MRWLAPLLLVTLTACPDAREDDDLEPDDTPAQANRLTPGEPIEARSNQDDPDVFALALMIGQVAMFRVDHRGLERCPRFELLAPDTTPLYRDPEFFCDAHGSSLTEPEVQVDAVRFEFDDGGYTLEVIAAAAGDHYLVVEETSQADNIAPFSWDYTVTATVMSAPDAGVE